jgi:hypothetical protein
VNVASSSPYDTVIFTESSPTSQRYGSGVGAKPENTVDGKVSLSVESLQRAMGLRQVRRVRVLGHKRSSLSWTTFP